MEWWEESGLQVDAGKLRPEGEAAAKADCGAVLGVYEEQKGGRKPR